MEVLQDQKKVVFTGHVDFRRGGVNMKSDKLVVTYVESAAEAQDQSGASSAASTSSGSSDSGASDVSGGRKTEVTFLDASGNVVIVTSRQTITGSEAHMDVKANTMVVTGDVVIKQGQTVMRGSRLSADLNTNNSQLTGGRVKGSFVPQ
jgi:lipopolysaccharide export system protein LptA